MNFRNLVVRFFFFFLLVLRTYFPPICGLHVCIADFIVDLRSIRLSGDAGIFQILMSFFTVSSQVFLGLPQPRLPGASKHRALLIEPEFLFTCPYQRNLLSDKTLSIEGIINFSNSDSELTRSDHLTCKSSGTYCDHIAEF